MNQICEPFLLEFSFSFSGYRDQALYTETSQNRGNVKCHATGQSVTRS